jgi:hypothetical protein
VIKRLGGMPTRGTAAPPRCLHCERLKVSRPRGLCAVCYFLPGLRHRYPLTDDEAGGEDGKWANREPGVAPKLPREATAAMPGTEAKIRVMEGRFGRREILFHPDDAVMDEESRGWCCP